MPASNKPKITYAELKAQLDGMTPAQLAQPIVWVGDERGGYVREVWIADEDWIGDPSDHETWLPRREALKHDPEYYRDAEVTIERGDVHLVVD